MWSIAPTALLHESMETILATIVEAAAHYCAYINEVLAVMLPEKVVGRPKHEIIANADAPLLNDMKLRFFTKVPGMPE